MIFSVISVCSVVQNTCHRIYGKAHEVRLSRFSRRGADYLGLQDKLPVLSSRASFHRFHFIPSIFHRKGKNSTRVLRLASFL